MKTGFNIMTLLVIKTGSVDINKDCNSITVTNTGDTIVFANDQILYPGTIGSILGDSRTWGGHQDEIYTGVLRVRFQVPLNANPEIEIIQKVYTAGPAVS